MGRPRNLPVDEALDRALLEFWARGYDRTSISDLSRALGVGPSSVYNAFGSKQELYRRSIERYTQTYTGFVETAAESDLDVVPSVRGLLRDAARVYASPETPPGCAIMQSAGAATAEESEAAAITLEVKAVVEQKLKRMLERSSRSHGTPLSASARVVAKYLIATLRGLSQLAIDGASEADLLRVADIAAEACVRQE